MSTSEAVETKTSPKKSNPRWWICCAMFGCGGLIFVWYALYQQSLRDYYESLPGTGNASQVFIGLSYLSYGMMLCCCLLLMFVRPKAASNVAAVLLCLPFADAFAVTLPAAQQVTMKTLRKSVEDNSRDLVTAIKRFTEETGNPPEKLSDLVPEYLESIPAIGPRRFPATHYRTGPPLFASEAAWCLWVECVSPGGHSFAVGYAGVRKADLIGDKNHRPVPQPKWEVTSLDKIEALANENDEKQ